MTCALRHVAQSFFIYFIHFFIECSTIFPNVSIRLQLDNVEWYGIYFRSLHPFRSAGISFAPAEAARSKSAKSWQENPSASITACPRILLVVFNLVQNQSFCRYTLLLLLHRCSTFTRLHPPGCTLLLIYFSASSV